MRIINGHLTDQAQLVDSDGLFERFAWFYAICRQYLFRDHTREISQSLFPMQPPRGTHVLELGCGPGLYTCNLAQLYPQITATGLDLSKSLIEWAKSHAARRSLRNCHFYRGDAQAIPSLPSSIDAVIISRLFLIVPDKTAVLAEAFRVLNPGGRCFIAEPTSTIWTRVPLACMLILAKLSGLRRDLHVPLNVNVMSKKEFYTLTRSQPWASVELVDEERYQYAVCTKPYDHQIKEAKVPRSRHQSFRKSWHRRYTSGMVFKRK